MSEPARDPRRLTAAERAARAGRIAASRAAGEPWAPIAEREGVSVRQARRLADEAARSGLAVVPRLGDLDPGALVARAVAALDRTMTDALALSLAAENDAARIGAMRTVVSAATALQAALTRAGLIGDPSLVRYRGELRSAVRVVFALGDRHGLPAGSVMAAAEEIAALRAAPPDLLEGVAS